MVSLIIRSLTAFPPPTMLVVDLGHSGIPVNRSETRIFASALCRGGRIITGALTVLAVDPGRSGIPANHSEMRAFASGLAVDLTSCQALSSERNLGAVTILWSGST